MSEPIFIDGGAGKLAIHDFGGEGDRVLLIAHATGFLAQVYRAFAQELTNELRVVGVDMRGHGDSDAPTDPADFNWRNMADDLARAITHIGATELHGFGHSIGGTAILEVERIQPGTLHSAMAFEPIVPPTTLPNGSPIVDAARRRLRTFPSHGHALERYSARPPLGWLRADVLHDYVHHGFSEAENGEITLKCSPESEANTFSMAGTVPLASLAEIELDVVIARSGDQDFAGALAQPAVEQLPNGRLLEFPTLTHFGPLQEPVIVAGEMRKLISSSSS